MFPLNCFAKIVVIYDLIEVFLIVLLITSYASALEWCIVFGDICMLLTYFQNNVYNVYRI